MYIFKPDRYFIKKRIGELSHYITGKTLDIGAGEVDRYGRYFKTSEYIRMEQSPVNGIDVVGSAYEIPFPDNTFDSIVCTQVFEHLAYPERAVKEIRRVLKKGGCVLVTVPQVTPLHEVPYDYFRYTNYGLQALFEDFECMEMKRCGNYHAVLAQLRICFWCDTWNLYDRPFLGRVFGKLIYWYGNYMLWRDNDSPASSLHTIGWCAVFKDNKDGR
jgi:SAM-dependent methyltransferase